MEPQPFQPQQQPQTQIPPSPQPLSSSPMSPQPQFFNNPDPAPMPDMAPPKKKLSLKLIFTIAIPILVIIVGVILFLILRPSGGGGGNGEETPRISFTENPKLIRSNKAWISSRKWDQFDTAFDIYDPHTPGEDENSYDTERYKETISVDNKVLARHPNGDDSSPDYLGDNIFSFSDISNKKVYFFKNGDQIHECNSAGRSFMFGLILCGNTMFQEGSTQTLNAFDPVAKKEVYSIPKSGAAICGIYYCAGKELLDIKTGKVVATTSDGQFHATSEAGGYFVAKKVDGSDPGFIKSYDKDHNLLSTLPLTYDYANSGNYELENILGNNMFITKTANSRKYNVYNQKAELVVTLDNIDTAYVGQNTEFKFGTDYSIVRGSLPSNGGDFVPYGVVIWSDKETLQCGVNFSGGFGDGDDSSKYGRTWDNYVLCDAGSKKFILNVETRKQFDLSELSGDSGWKIRTASYDNKHLIVYGDGGTNILLDQEYKQAYSAKNTLKFINDEYMVEYNDDGTTMIRIKDLEKKTLNVIGRYYGHNAAGLVTKDDEKKEWHLYKF